MNDPQFLREKSSNKSGFRPRRRKSRDRVRENVRTWEMPVSSQTTVSDQWPTRGPVISCAVIGSKAGQCVIVTPSIQIEPTVSPRSNVNCAREYVCVGLHTSVRSVQLVVTFAFKRQYGVQGLWAGIGN